MYNGDLLNFKVHCNFHFSFPIVVQLFLRTQRNKTSFVIYFLHTIPPNNFLNIKKYTQKKIKKLKNSTSVQRRPFVNQFRSLRLPEDFHWTWKMPSFRLRRRLEAITGAGNWRYRHTHWSRSHHHPRKILNSTISKFVNIVVRNIHFRFQFFVLCFTASLTLTQLENRPKWWRFVHLVVTGRLTFSVAGIFVSWSEERNSDGSRSPESRLTIYEIGDSSDWANSFATAAANTTGRWGEERKRRGSGGRRRRRRGVASTGTYVSTIRAKNDETVLETNRANSAPPSLRGVFWTFPHLFFIQVECHF